MKPTVDQYARIYNAWQQSLPALQVAKRLRLVPVTVIAEYVRLDEVVQALTPQAAVSEHH